MSILVFIVIFIFAFIIILWFINKPKKPYVFTDKDRQEQAEILEGIEQDWRARIIDMQLDEMGIELSKDDKS